MHVRVPKQAAGTMSECQHNRWSTADACGAVQSGAQLEGLAATLAKPLRCLWVSQQSRIWLNQVADLRDLPFTPLVLVSASDPAASHAHHTLGEPARLYFHRQRSAAFGMLRSGQGPMTHYRARQSGWSTAFLLGQLCWSRQQWLQSS